MYAVAFGKRLFGKVDKVPGKYHVATLCWHFCYLPLIPSGSFLVLGERVKGVRTIRTQFQGIRIPFSVKSLIIAWTRSLLTVPFVILAIALIGIPAAAEHVNYDSYHYAIGVEVVVGLLLFGPYLIPGVGRATANRAKELARFAGSSS